MSAFTDIASRSFQVLDHIYGEPLLVTPWIAGDMLAGYADPATPAYTITGILDIPVKIDRTESAMSTHGSRADLVLPAPTVDFDLSIFGALPLPQSNWRITASTRPGAPVFKIVAAEPDGAGRMTCPLMPV